MAMPWDKSRAEILHDPPSGGNPDNMRCGLGGGESRSGGICPQGVKVRATVGQIQGRPAAGRLGGRFV